MEGAYEHQTQNQLSNFINRLEAKNQIELRKLRMYHDKMDKIKHSLVRDSDRRIKFFERKKLNPLREKKKCLETKQKLRRQEEMKRDEVQPRKKILEMETLKYNPHEPYGRWVRLPKYHKE